MANKIDFNIILVITLLLIVIIFLSGIKICRIPFNKLMDSRFIDTKYSYVSEHFVTQPTLDPILSKLGDIGKDSIGNVLTQTIDQQKQNRQINILMNQVSSLENKMNVLNQMW